MSISMGVTKPVLLISLDQKKTGTTCFPEQESLSERRGGQDEMTLYLTTCRAYTLFSYITLIASKRANPLSMSF